MSKILAFTNQKGGVGKTTSAVNVALSLAVSEVKTLLIDLDPQSNATTGLSELFGDLNGNIYDIGFQVLNTAYQNTFRFLDEDEIKLRMFKPGAVIHDGSSFKLISDPLRDPKQLFVSLFSSLSSFKDKLRVLSLIFNLSNYDIQKDKSEDMETINFLKNRNVFAAIDVFPQEPFPKNHKLRKLKNVIFSPHRAGALNSAFKEMGELVIQDLKLISKGLPPKLCKKAERETVKYLRSKPVDIN